MINKIDVLNLIKNNPVQIGKWAGFTDLRELHNLWIKEMLFGKEDYTLQAHRASYKTTCLSISIALYMMIFPTRSIFFLRKTDNDVREILKQVAKILSNPKFVYLSSIIWNKEIAIIKSNDSEITTNIYTSSRGVAQLVGQGIKSSMTGKHFDFVITDDIVNLDDRISKAEREQTKLKYQELLNIKNRGGRILNTGTPWHKDDCFSIMPKAVKYDCYTTGIMTIEQIEEKRKSIAPSLFSANYELKHIASDNILFSNPKFINDYEFIRDGYCHIDASYGGEDFTAFTCGRMLSDGRIVILGKLWHSHVDNCLPQILDIKKKYMLGRTYVEDNGDKQYLKKRLRDYDDVVSSYHESTNKNIKICTNIYRDWQNIYFLEETDKKYIEQITDYTEDAEHDDAPDSLSCICRLLYKKRNGILDI